MDEADKNEIRASIRLGSPPWQHMAMMTREEGLQLYARVLAVKAAVVAMLRTSRSPELAAVLEQELEKMQISLLGNANAPDSCIAAFEEESESLRKALG